jgi:DNA processing protein
VVVEAAPKSGSLITARLAAEAGREVMAVPGSPLDPRAQGCNQLIREGATLIQTAADVVETIRPLDSRVQSGGVPFELSRVEVGVRTRCAARAARPSPVLMKLVSAFRPPSGAVQLVLLELVSPAASTAMPAER